MERSHEEILDYCKDNICDFSERLAAAFDDIFKYRAPLYLIDPGLDEEILDCIEEFCEDNDLDAEDVDIEDLIRYE